MARRRARRARRGSGSVFYDETERCWMAIYPLGTRAGRRVRRKARARTEDGAKAKLESFRRLYGAGGTPSTATLDEYLRDWLRDHGPSIRPSTLASYAGHVDLHIGPLLGGIRLDRLQPADVRRLVADLERKRLAPATIRLVVTTLRVALNAAVAERTLVDNPAARIRLPKIEREPVRALTPIEADAILEAVAGHWCEPLVRLLVGSGMRIGEAIGLDQRDLQLDAGFVRIRVSKTQARAVPISDDAIAGVRQALAAAPRLGPNAPVFFSPRKRGERLRRHSVSHALPKLLAAAGLGRLTPHGLRHGAATIMLAGGSPMRAIAEQLGHRNPALTARLYAHVVPELQRAAVQNLERSRAR